MLPKHNRITEVKSVYETSPMRVQKRTEGNSSLYSLRHDGGINTVSHHPQEIQSPCRLYNAYSLCIVGETKDKHDEGLGSDPICEKRAVSSDGLTLFTGGYMRALWQHSEGLAIPYANSCREVEIM